LRSNELDNLSAVVTKEKYIPVGDCKWCGVKDTPFSGEWLNMVHKITKKKLSIYVITCPKCACIINYGKEDLKPIKGYISEQDLINNGYTKQ
jgi:hypothetical protein